MGEPGFVGQDRIAIVDRLEAIWEEACGQTEARWVAIEAHSGWGKSRIVQEFYRRIAAKQGYWPPAICDETLPPEQRRKQVIPRAWTRPAGAEMG